MSGLGLVLDIAKEALLTQKYAIDVASHNIANVNTPGYTRQTAVLEAKEASPLGGVMLGRGVTIDRVIQNADSFIESRLRERNSDLSSLSEKEVYMSTMEGIFNESSDQSLSTQLNDLWNAWQDLSNNPSGMPERNILYERGSLLCDSLQGAYGDMNKMLSELNNSIATGIDKVNDLLSNIAVLNQQIIQVEVNGNANDLRDQRTQALNDLAQYMDVKSYENEDGSLTVTTGRGYVLVSRSDAYPLEMDANEVKWIGSGTTTVTITDMIAGGKLGGWLDMRDKIIPEYKADLDSFAKELIWQMNKVHSQGAGTEAFSSVTGTNAVSDAAEELGTVDSGLANYDSIASGSFHIWVRETATGIITDHTVNIDPAARTLSSLAGELDGFAGVIADDSGGRLSITANAGYTFAFSSDTSNVLAALGVNTFFTGSSADSIGMNSVLETNKALIAAGRVGSTGEIAVGDGSNALAISDLQDQSFNVDKWTYERGSPPVSSTGTGTLDTYLHSFVGAVGIDSQSITRAKSFNQAIIQTLSTTRDNISGVSLDEEMTSLIQYQHAYTAAAKLVTAADEMLKTLLGTV